ncbi:MAG: prepilin-type N-terminal cleavage/methylation domain-containing protein, partial [Fimbriimonadaceae bacterium]|nr:prepilin-type N-terminal cleavage/methylation domain-containing protein [Fimbriimonadaceae bacterium]
APTEPEMKQRAFTLTELLTVVAILVVMAGLSYHFIGEGISRGKEAVTLSNLRQCGAALAIYAPEQTYPVSYEAAKVALEKAPTRDPLDTRSRAEIDRQPRPFIGSYGYIRGVHPYEDESLLASYGGEGATRTWRGMVYPVMASTWLGKPLVTEFEAVDDNMNPGPKFQACMKEETCRFPDRIAYLFADGSARTSRKKEELRPHFAWFLVFAPSNL